MRDYITFGDVCTLDYDIYIFDLNSDMSPVYELNEVVIPGRNGTLLLSHNRMENVEQRYMGVIYENAEENLRWFRDAIMKNDGYQRLEDSFHPDEFYTARYIGGLEPKLTPERQMVKFAIEFSRKPQRFLKEGEQTETFSATGAKIDNPTSFPARPLIKIVGNGTVTVGGTTITVASHSNPNLVVDSEIMDCYYGATNCNQYVSFSSNDFPTIPGGSSTVNFTGSVTSVEITPRWWTV